jgi:hypothetical protein
MRRATANTLAIAFVLAGLAGCKAHEPPSVSGDTGPRRVTLRRTTAPEATVGALTLRIEDLVHAAYQEDSGVRYVSTATLAARVGSRDARVQIDAEADVLGYHLKVYMAGGMTARPGGPVEDTLVLDVTPPSAAAP